MKLDLSSYTPYGVEPIERASRDEIAARQTARIKATVARVYDNVPAYRNKFDAARVHPSDFSALEDLAKFPFTTKQDLRDNYPFGMWTLAFGHHEDRTPTHGYEATREAAMAAFARSWRRE